MTLEQIAYLSEIIGVALIIASLVYVARQLHQNTEIVRAGNAIDLVQINIGIATPVTEDHELAELWINAGLDFDSLDSVDQERMVLFEFRAIQAWHSQFNLWRKGLASDEDWNQILWIIKNIGMRQSVRVSWNRFKGAFNSEFQDLVGSYLESEPKGSTVIG